MRHRGRNAVHALGMALVAASVSSGAAAEIYRCEDAAGQATYQETRCDPGTVSQRAIVIEPPVRNDRPPAEAASRVPPPAATEPATRAERPEATGRTSRTERPDRDLAMLLLVKIGCDDELPGFTQRTQDGYAAWRKRNLQQVLRVERGEGFRLSVVQYRLERALRPVATAGAPAASESDSTGKARTYADALCYGSVASALGLEVRP